MKDSESAGERRPHLPDYGPEEWNETVEKFGA